jgi:hypothetical protein
MPLGFGAYASGLSCRVLPLKDGASLRGRFIREASCAVAAGRCILRASWWRSRFVRLLAPAFVAGRMR